jgi:maltodextrin utilization protein YvdJ
VLVLVLKSMSMLMPALIWVLVLYTWVLQLTRNSTLFLIAQVQWVYVMYLGIAALPFVARSEFLLAPLLRIVGG